jgi:hypothetical protein
MAESGRGPYDALATRTGSSIQAKGAQVAKTNFTFEKRRKELERKKKREAKLQAKLDKRAAAAEGSAPTPENEVPEADAPPRP